MTLGTKDFNERSVGYQMHFVLVGCIGSLLIWGGIPYIINDLIGQETSMAVFMLLLLWWMSVFGFTKVDKTGTFHGWFVWNAYVCTAISWLFVLAVLVHKAGLVKIEIMNTIS